MIGILSPSFMDRRYVKDKVVKSFDLAGPARCGLSIQITIHLMTVSLFMSLHLVISKKNHHFQLLEPIVNAMSVDGIVKIILSPNKTTEEDIVLFLRKDATLNQLAGLLPEKTGIEITDYYFEVDESKLLINCKLNSLSEPFRLYINGTHHFDVNIDENDISARMNNLRLSEDDL